jgi:hypothetical protein
MVLKIIGFVILALLALLLLLLLTTLLVPIRYRIAVEHGEALCIRGRVHWLLHIVHTEASYVENKLHISVRLFGFVIYDNLKPKVPKVRKKKIRKSKMRNQPIKKKKSVQIRNSRHTKANKAETNSSIIIDTPKDNLEEGKKPEVIEIDINKASEYETVLKQKKNEEYIIPSEQKKSSEIVFNSKQISRKQEELRKEHINDEEIWKEESEREEQKLISDKKPSFFQRLSERFHEIKEKLISGVKNFISKIKNIFTTVKTFKYKWDLIYSFIQDEMNRQGFHVTLKSLKRMLKHILPTRLKSKIIFGTGDPCSTGQLLGVLGFLYGFYGDKVQITPDFENSRLEGKHDARGRIRLITILIIAVKLILDKRFKQLKMNATLLKEAL